MIDFLASSLIATQTHGATLRGGLVVSLGVCTESAFCFLQTQDGWSESYLSVERTNENAPAMKRGHSQDTVDDGRS